MKFENTEVIVTNIQWDTDNEEIEGLKNKMTIIIPKEEFENADIENAEELEQFIDDFINDEISNLSGFCHFGFEMKINI